MEEIIHVIDLYKRLLMNKRIQTSIYPEQK